mmetsp:Transcript_5348/g.5305  ORF Transcript_5348/g.5305 Transcript_5348/m.5305 type:complete len:82 (-) Transcript_5348:28-273(-)
METKGKPKDFYQPKKAHRTPQSSPTPSVDRPRASTPAYDRPPVYTKIEQSPSRSPFKKPFQSSREYFSQYSPVHVNYGYRN